MQIYTFWAGCLNVFGSTCWQSQRLPTDFSVVANRTVVANNYLQTYRKIAVGFLWWVLSA